MTFRLRAALAAGLAGALLVSVPHAQQPPDEPAPISTRRQLLRELAQRGSRGVSAREVIPGPAVLGTLGGLRTAPVQPVAIDPTGTPLPALPGAANWEVDPDTGAQYRRGEVLVKFRPGAGPAVRARAMAAAGADRVLAALPGGWQHVSTHAQVSERSAMAALQLNPDVEAVSLNYRLSALQHRPNDELYELQWNFDAIDLPRAWDINPGARSDVIVAVVDGGLNVTTNTVVYTGPLGRFALQFAMVPDLVSDGRVVNAFDFVYGDTLPMDLGGHGTHVAGTIAQQTDNLIGLAGIAYNVRLMPIKVLADEWDDVLAPGNPGGSSAGVATGIVHAADNGAKVINLSLGGFAPAPILDEAIRYAVDKGAFVSIAAGNEGARGNRVEYPASYGSEIDGAMTVGAVSRELRRAPYSSFHPYVEICAPGGEARDESEYETGVTQISYDPLATLARHTTQDQKRLLLLAGFRPRFDRFQPIASQGTSMAAPHVAGIAALLYSQGITSPSAIEEAITRFARSIDAREDECGSGLVDPRRTLLGLGLAR